MTLNISKILDGIKYKDWKLKHKDDYIQWTWTDTCSKTGEQKPWSGRKWKLSEHMTESELVGTAFLALNTALEHEAREFFRYNDKIVFNPHISIHVLQTVCDEEDIRT